MKIIACNRLEKLAARLVEVIGGRRLSRVLAREVVVVQSRGMARWLTLEVARMAGVCMNFQFEFPRTIVEDTLGLFFPELSARAYAPEVMIWRIHEALGRMAGARGFEEVRGYVEADDGLRKLQLCGRIAGVFDQYLVYRPEMLMEWERKSGAGGWQGALWRELVKRGGMHLAAVSGALEDGMKQAPSGGAAKLPERVSLFSIASLPPLYVRVLMGLSRHCEVNLFCVDPSREYHGDDTPAKGRGRRRLAKVDDALVGNPLLASMGKLNREFTEVRLEMDERAGFVMQEEEMEFVEPGGDSMLHAVQGDVLHARCGGTSEWPRRTAKQTDQSIAVHVCHSPTREVEVLYDQLLDLFSRDASLRPRDVVVMTPDIEKYGPFIKGVFEYPEDGRARIPYSVADRRPLSLSPVIEAYGAILALVGGRCAATELYGVLDRGPIRRRFEFADEDMATIERWISETGIRWGLDGAQRAAFAVPALEANTWRAGLKRLVLGYAMAGGNRRMFDGVMPYDEVEGGAVELLGRFLTAVEDLFAVTTELSVARPLGEWPDAFADVIDRFFSADDAEEAADLRLVREALEHFRQSMEDSENNEVISFRAARHHLMSLLGGAEQRGGFLTGGVTFCALQPMRSIPARVICLIGMNDAAFPRQAQPAGFDLMAREPRIGDRSPRDDDRYIFLEALISARERLYCSYVGRSVTGDGESPPSVVVSELLDYLDRAFEFPRGDVARDAVVTGHRLHAFSPRYFDGKTPALFSYSESNSEAARSFQKSDAEDLAQFLAQPLPEPGEEARQVELQSLIEFFGNPAKYFVKRRLGLALESDQGSLEDHEPFDIGSLAAYHLKQEIVARGLERAPMAEKELAARGVLPLGDIGTARFQKMNREAGHFRESVEAELRNEKAGEPLLIDVRAGAFLLSGKIDEVYEIRNVQFRCATLKPKDKLRAWVTHVARCAHDAAAAGETTLIGEDGIMRMRPLNNAPEILRGLLEIYWAGLTRPLPFFPGSSLEFVRREMFPSQRAGSSPIQMARSKWFGSNYGEKSQAERDDDYYIFCFGETDPIGEEFAQLSRAVFRPMFENAE